MATSYQRQFGNVLLDHYQHPRNVGRLPTDNTHTGTGTAGTASEGGMVRLQLRVDASGIIEDTRFKAYGCGATIAAASWLSEAIKGKTADQAQKLGGQAIADALQLPPGKLHCAFLAHEALENALANYTDKQE
ncbi:MAG TPA: iron-sulfur cluster assembly scaffold protein [Burkholderiaceae bacterium]|nr:iron-sulfur cluster assembly scaffold protein [Burkholderiaceae bacterium]